MGIEGSKLVTIDYAFLLAILTALLYLLSFLFYSGKLFYYHLPLSFVELNIQQIIYSSLHLAPIIILCSWYGVSLLRKYKSQKNDGSQPGIVTSLSRKNRKTSFIGIIKYIFFVYCLPTIVIILLYVFDKKGIWPFLIGVLIPYFVGIVFNLYKKRNYVYLMILVFVYSTVISFGIGYFKAWTEDDYIVTEKNKEAFIVLTTYNDKFIIAPFNEKTKSYKNQYQIVEVKDISHFKVTKTGKIKLK